MSAEQDVVKENIIQWCKDDKITYNDMSKNNPNFSWVIGIGKTSIIIYKAPQVSDRIFVESRIKLAPEHEKLVNEDWAPGKKTNMILKLRTLSVQLDFNIAFTTKEKDKITETKSNKIHFHSSIKKADFLQLFLRVSNIHDHILTQVSALLQTEVKQLQAVQDAGSENPLSG